MSSWGAIYDIMTTGLQARSRALIRIQEQITTGAKIIRASDSPADAYHVMSLQAQGQSLESYSKNLNRILSDREQASSSLQELSTSFIRVRELLTQGASGTYSQSQRAAMASEIDSLLERAVSTANTQSLGKYLFAGDNTSLAPYSVERPGAKITAVTYQGALVNSRVPVAPGVEHPATVIGDTIFRRDQREGPSFFGNTGAAAGIGTSSVRGDVWLTLEHDTTTYLGATGVAAGTSSAAGDTILGTSHKLTIDADNTTIRLDTGQNQTYDTGSDNNLRLQNAAGDVVYVDMTSLDGGLSGIVEVSITATGTMSIDDGDSTAALATFTTNEAVTDLATGRVLYVGATGIARIGVEPVRVGGTYDVFGLLIGVRDMLTNDRSLSEADQGEQLSEALESLTEVMAGLTEGIASVGGQLQAMDALQTSLADIEGKLTSQRSGIQDADIIELATALAWNQTYYEMMLASTARMLSLSLMDYLR
jgi:flagellar hook-associated protein 3 FlgL